MDLTNDADLDRFKSEDPLSLVSVSYEKKKMLRFTCQQDILLLNQVLAVNPYEALKQKLSWEHIAFLMMQHGLQVDGRRCRERTQLLLDYLQNREFRTLRKRGTEAENDEKERLLREILVMRDRRSLNLCEQSTEKLAQMQQERAAQLKMQLLGLTATNGNDPTRRALSPEMSSEKMVQAQQEREAQIRNLQALGLSVTNGSDFSRRGTSSPNDKTVQSLPPNEVEIRRLGTQGSSMINGNTTSRGSTPTPSGYSTSGEADDPEEPPPAKRRCDESRGNPYSLHKSPANKDFTMKQEHLEFARRQFEAEIEQKKELVALERAKLDFEKDKLEFEKVKFEAERWEREKRLQMESEERKLLVQLLLKVLNCGSGGALNASTTEGLCVCKAETLSRSKAEDLNESSRSTKELCGSTKEGRSNTKGVSSNDAKDLNGDGAEDSNGGNTKTLSGNSAEELNGENSKKSEGDNAAKLQNGNVDAETKV